MAVPENKFPRPLVDAFRYSFCYLTQAEYDHAAEYGAARNRLARSRGVKDQVFDSSQGSRAVDKTGIIAEAGYLKILGKDVFENLNLNWRPGDPGYDHVLFDKKIQVKGTTYCPGRLMLNDLEKRKYDVAVLMNVTGKKVVAQGYIFINEFMQIRKIGDKKAHYKKADSVAASQLHELLWLPYECQYGLDWRLWWEAQIPQSQQTRQS